MTDDSELERRLRSQLSDAEWRSEEIAARFSESVVARIRRRRRLRAVMLTTAGAAGFAISGLGLEEIVRQTPLLRVGLAAALTAGPLFSVCLAVALAVLVAEMLQTPSKV